MPFGAHTAVFVERVRKSPGEIARVPDTPDSVIGGKGCDELAQSGRGQPRFNQDVGTAPGATGGSSRGIEAFKERFMGRVEAAELPQGSGETPAPALQPQ